MSKRAKRGLLGTLERLVQLSPGAKIKQYGLYTNLTYVGRDNGHVTMRDSCGNEKRVYESLFLRHAYLEPNASGEGRRPAPERQG